MHMQAGTRLPLRSIPVPQRASIVFYEERLLPDFHMLSYLPVCYVRIVDKGTVSIPEGVRRIFARRGFVAGRGHGPMQVIPMVICRIVRGANC